MSRNTSSRHVPQPLIILPIIDTFLAEMSIIDHIYHIYANNDHIYVHLRTILAIQGARKATISTNVTLRLDPGILKTVVKTDISCYNGLFLAGFLT